MDKFTLKDGSVSAYGLACGYIDIKHRTTKSGVDVEVRLSNNGATYDIDVHVPGEPNEFVEINGGAKVLEGWAQFDKLTDARRFQKKLVTSPNIKTTGDMMFQCLHTHY